MPKLTPRDSAAPDTILVYGSLTNSFDLIIASLAFKLVSNPLRFISLIQNRKRNGTLLASQGSNSVITRVPEDIWYLISRTYSKFGREEGKAAFLQLVCCYSGIDKNGKKSNCNKCKLAFGARQFDLNILKTCCSKASRIVDVVLFAIDRNHHQYQFIRTMLAYYDLQLATSVSDSAKPEHHLINASFQYIVITQKASSGGANNHDFTTDSAFYRYFSTISSLGNQTVLQVARHNSQNLTKMLGMPFECLDDEISMVGPGWLTLKRSKSRALM